MLCYYKKYDHEYFGGSPTKDYGKIPKFCCVEFNALYKLCVILRIDIRSLLHSYWEGYPMIIETVMRSSVSRVGQG